MEAFFPKRRRRPIFATEESIRLNKKVRKTPKPILTEAQKKQFELDARQRKLEEEKLEREVREWEREMNIWIENERLKQELQTYL